MSRPRRKLKSPQYYKLELIEQRVLLSATALPVSHITLPPDVTTPTPVGFNSPVQGPHWSDSAIPADSGSTTPVGIISPEQMRGAYGVSEINFGSVAGDGSGQTIAIVDAYDDPTAEADLTTFDNFYDIAPPPSFEKMNDQGQASPLPGVDPADGWEGEESLDIQWAHVMAPGASIILFEAASETDLYNTVYAAAHTPGVSVVSMSWSSAEFPGETSLDTPDFTTPNGHTGISFVAAAGDSGIYALDDPTTIQPQYPDTSPNVISVGGTTLTVNGDAYGGEIGWGSGSNSALKDYGGGGGGGGISAYEAKPEYQDFLDGLSSTNKTYPDVSMEADNNTGVPVVDSYDYGSAAPWSPGPIGGTSLATPMFAGLLAVADQGRVLNGLGTLDGPSQTLSRLYQLPDADYHDITVGDNGYEAGPGYDLVTGRGSPVANLLVPDLASNSIGFHVFLDTNVDGIQESGEPGLSGVSVSLKTSGPDHVIGTADDVVVQTSTTDGDGLYEFTDIPAGSYYVHVNPPVGYKVSPVGDSSALTTNSTFDSAGDSALIVVNASTFDDLVNVGVHTETVSINDVTISRPHSGLAPMVFTVSITPPNTVPTDVPYTTADDTATVANDDYIPTSGTVVFPAGATSETITVDAVGNLTIENDVDFHVDITAPSGYYPLKTVGVGTILNTNFPAAAVSGSPTLKRSATETLNFQFTVTLSAPAPFPVTVPYNTSDGSAVGNIDYQPTSGSITFDANTTGPQYVTVPVYPGSNRQLDKTFYLNLQSSLTAVLGTPAQAVGTILTNAPPALSVSAAAVTESPTASVVYLPFTVDVAPSLSGTVTVNYATSDGTAVAGKDYTAESGTLTFYPGRIEQIVNVPVYQQFIAQQDKTVNFTLSDAVGSVILLDSEVTGTIHYLTLAALPVSAKQKASYFDALNQRVTVSMRGPGSADVVFIGATSNETNAFEIVVNGTTTASTLSIDVARGGQTTFQNITASGALGVLDAGTTNILSSVAIAGAASTIKLGYVAGAAITIGGASTGASVALTFNRLLNSTITSAIPISSLTAGAYLNTTGSPIDITAPSVGTVKVKGNFGGTIVATNVKALDVGGVIADGAIIASGNIGSVTATSITGSSFLAGVAGGLTSVPAIEADFVNQQSLIGKIKVRSGVFSDSVIAGWSVQSVAVGAGSAQSAAASAVTANHVGSVSSGTDSVKNPAARSAVDGISVDLI